MGELRHSIYSRFGFEWASSLVPYGPRFRLHRRIYHQVFHAGAAGSYRPKQLQKAYEMLTHILQEPADFAEHVDMFVGRYRYPSMSDMLSCRFSTSVVMSVAYGYDIVRGDAFVVNIKRALDIFLRVSTPESAAILGAFPRCTRVHHGILLILHVPQC